jgi:hypothetical protein
MPGATWAGMVEKALADPDLYTKARAQIVAYLTLPRSGKIPAEKVCTYTQGTHDGFIEALAAQEMSRGMLVDMVKQLAARISDLEAAAQKPAPTMKYVGVHREGEEYQPGNFVTWGGSMWHANEVTKARPGDGGTWTLCVKKGRDAKPEATR